MHALTHPAAKAAVRASSFSELNTRRFVPPLIGPHGRLAIALLLDRPDDTEAHGNLALVRNDQLSWIATLTMPAGRQCRSEVLSGNLRLKEGSPSIEFVPLSPTGLDVRTTAAIDWLAGPTGQVATDDLGRHLPRPFLEFDRKDSGRLTSAILSGPGGFPISTAVYRRFRRALSTGLVLRATGPEVYLGVVGHVPGFSVHRLRSGIDGKDRLVRLPDPARMLVKPGQALDPDQPWAAALPVPPDPMKSKAESRSTPPPWPRVRRLCGSSGAFRRYLRLWLGHRQLRLPTQPGSFLMPASLIGPANRRVEPTGIWWDTAPFLPRYDWESQSAVLPPLTLEKPGHLSDLKVG